MDTLDTLNNYFVGIDKKDTDNALSDAPKYIIGNLTKNTNGYGKLFNKNMYYNGQIKDGFFEGSGYIEFNNYEYFPTYKSYEGNFKNGEFDGDGKIIYTDGNIFIGKFKNNKKNGPGKLYNINGDLIKNSIWKNDNIYGKYIHLEWHNKSENIPSIIGKMHNNIKVGPWVQFYKDSNIEKIIYYKDVEPCDCKETCECTFQEMKESFINLYQNSVIRATICKFISACDESIHKTIINYIENKLHTTKIVYDIKKTKVYDSFLDYLKIYKSHAIPYVIPNNSKKIYIINLLNTSVPNNIIEISDGKYNTKVYITKNGNITEYMFSLANNNYYIYQNAKLVYKGLLTINMREVYDTTISEEKHNLIKIVYYDYMYDGKGEEYNNVQECYEFPTVLYSGEYKNGNIVNGIIYDKVHNNKIYEGDIRNKIPHGEGMFYDLRGRVVYCGQVENGMNHGVGMSYLNGVIEWDGGWNNGRKHGSGKLYDTNGNLICICQYDQNNFMFAI
jgi:hypothetical protein